MPKDDRKGGMAWKVYVCMLWGGGVPEKVWEELGMAWTVSPKDQDMQVR